MERSEAARPDDRPPAERPAREDGAPDWVRDALRSTAGELAAYVATGVRFTVAPRRFARELTAGTGRALNPLGVLATAAAVVGAANDLGARAAERLGGPPAPGLESTLLWQLLLWLYPFVAWILLGAACHLALLPVGRRPRPRLRSSVALALYAGGGPGAAGMLATITGALALLASHAAVDPVTAGAVLWWLPFLLALVPLVLSLAELHRVRAAWAALAMALSLAVVRFAFARALQGGG